MADERHEITITARDGTSQTFVAIGRAGIQAGKDIETGAKAGADAQKRLSDQLTRTGAAIGGVVGITSKLGQAHQSEERQISALHRAYGEQADEVEELAASLQKMGIASDDAVRVSALGAQSLITNYGLTADQINQLIERSADLSAVTFDQQGNQLALADVMQRVAGAIRGEGEAAELLGFAMSDSAVQAAAAAAGLTGWNTTMSESEKAAFRFQLILEQSNHVQGAAAEQADTTAGRVNALKMQVLDAAAGFGGLLGPVGETAAVLGDLALAAPAVGAGLGKLAGSATAARVGTAALTLATGPVGLVAAAAAAAGGLIYLATQADDYVSAADSAASATASLADTYSALAASLDSVGEKQALANLLTDFDDVQTKGQENVETLNQINAAIVELKTVGSDTAGIGALDALSEADAKWLESTYGNGDALLTIQELEAAAGAFGAAWLLTSDQVTAVAEDISAGLGHAGVDAKKMTEDFDAALEKFKSGTLDPEEFVAEIDRIAAAWSTYTDDVLSAAAETANSRTAIDLMTGALSSQVVVLDAATAAVDKHAVAIAHQKNAQRGREQDNYWNVQTGAIESQVVVIDEATAAVDRHANAIAREKNARRGREQDAYWANVAQDIYLASEAYDEWRVKNEGRGKEQDAYLAEHDGVAYVTAGIEAQAHSLDGLVVAQERASAASGVTALASEGMATRLAAAEAAVIEQTEALLGYAQAALEASTSTAVLDSAISVILGGTDNMTSGIGKVEDSLTGLFDASDGWATMDQLLYENRISQEEYNAALKATTDTQFNNNEAALDAATIQARQAPLLAELAWKQGLWVDEVSRMSAEQQLVALGFADSAKSAQALSLQTQIAAAAAGDLGEGGKKATKEIIRGIAEADPVMAAMLENMGLISIGAEGTIKINWPEEGQSDIDRLTESLDKLGGKIEVLVGIDIDDDGLIGWKPPDLEPIEWPVDLKLGGDAGDADAVDELLRRGGVGPDGLEIPVTPVISHAEAPEFDPIEWPVNLKVEGEGGPDRDAVLEMLGWGSDDPVVIPVGMDDGDFQAGADDVVGRSRGVENEGPVVPVDADESLFVATTTNTWARIKELEEATATTDVYANDQASGVIGTIGDMLANLPTFKEITVNTNYTATGTQGGFAQHGGLIQPAAHGRVSSSALTLVGETGPELVQLPYGSSVTPAGATKGRLRNEGGGGDTYNFYGNIITPDPADFPRQIYEYKRAGR